MKSGMESSRCFYCQKTLSNKTFRIQCIECSNSNRLVILCLECFSSGIEIGQHKSYHSYQILNDNGMCLLGGRNGWSYSELQSLLDALELFNIGDWLSISDHVGTRSIEECQDYYKTYFINGNIGRASITHDMIIKRPKDHTERDIKQETKPPILHDLSIQDQQEIGYMSLRDDFEREFDSDAETDLVNLEITAEDDDMDMAHKMLRVELYRDRLKEREHRKSISKEYGILIDATSAGSKKNLANKRKFNKDEKELKDRLKLHARFQKSTEHEQMYHCLVKERRMKNRIKELVRYRRNGITKLEDCAEFDSTRILREKKKEMQQKIGYISPSITSYSSHHKKNANENLSDPNLTSGTTANNRSQQIFKSMPGYDLLSPKELQLCKSLLLVPLTYITLKTCFIKDDLQRRRKEKEDINFSSSNCGNVQYSSHDLLLPEVQIDKTHRKLILDFLSENHWIESVNNNNSLNYNSNNLLSPLQSNILETKVS